MENIKKSILEKLRLLMLFRKNDNNEQRNDKNTANNLPLELCIGLDIGTSTTKVAIRNVFDEEHTCYLVDFEKHGEQGQEYLIPTSLCEDRNGVFYLPLKDEKCTYTNLKLNFMKNKENAKMYFRAYIALIIRYTKDWFIKIHGNDDIVKNREIIWQVNMGIPSKQFNDKGGNAKFIQILKEAYNLSNLNKITKQSSFSKENDVILNIVPEIIASIQSFIKRNDISHDGLYCVSDIGAGTLDVCTFRVKENDGNVIYSFFKSDVAELGVQKYIENKDKIENYKNDVLTCFRIVLFRTYKKRDPHASEWTHTLPFYVSGGGISIPFYQNIIKELNLWLTKNCGDHKGDIRCKGFYKIQPPAVDCVTHLKNIDTKRIGVALGLSYPRESFDDIKEYYKECEIEDIEQPKRKEIQNEYISKEMT